MGSLPSKDNNKTSALNETVEAAKALLPGGKVLGTATTPVTLTGCPSYRMQVTVEYRSEVYLAESTLPCMETRIRGLENYSEKSLKI